MMQQQNFWTQGAKLFGKVRSFFSVNVENWQVGSRNNLRSRKISDEKTLIWLILKLILKQYNAA